MDLLKSKKSYEKYGFCVIEKFFNKDSIQKVRKFSNHIKKLKPKSNQIMKYYENSIINQKKKF